MKVKWDGVKSLPEPRYITSTAPLCLHTNYPVRGGSQIGLMWFACEIHWSFPTFLKLDYTCSTQLFSLLFSQEIVCPVGLYLLRCLLHSHETSSSVDLQRRAGASGLNWEPALLAAEKVGTATVHHASGSELGAGLRARSAVFVCQMWGLCFLQINSISQLSYNIWKCHSFPN